MYHTIQRDLTAESWMLTMYNSSYQNPYINIKNICQENPLYLSLFYKIIAETRDIQEGKGNLEETYELIRQWIDINEEQALNALKKVATQYGSWRDVKYMCLRLNQHPQHEQYQTFIERSLQWMNDCLNKNVAKGEVFQLNSGVKQKSLNYFREDESIKKWIPRERSRFGLFYDFLATDYYQRIHGMDPKFPMDYYRKKYRQMLSKRETLIRSKKQPMVENEKDLIRRAFQYANTYFTEQEEMDVEQKWQACISNYPVLPNGLPILDSLIYDQQQNRQPNIPVLLTLFQILYKTEMPTYKRVLITYTDQPVWIDLTGKTLVKCIQTILSIQTFHHLCQKEQNDSRVNGLIQGVEWLSQSIMVTNTTVETVEKMVWLVISSFSKTEDFSWHSKIQTCFMNSYVMPHFVYIQTTNGPNYFQTPLIVWSETPRTMWFTLNSEKGITRSQWRQIAKIGSDSMVRQFTCFQNYVDMIHQDRYRDMEL